MDPTTWAMPEWAFGYAAAFSLVTFVASLAIVPWLVVRWPADHFMRERPPKRLWTRVARNLLGLVLLMVGVAMLVLPGQGLLTMFVGLLLVDVPGKRRLEIAILRRRPVERLITKTRRRAGHPPLELPQ